MDACLKEAKRIEYEELYRKAWDAQRKRDAAVDPRLRLKEDEKKKRFFSVLPKNRPLNNLGRQVDRMARNGMDVCNISIALNIPEPEVRRIMKDYGLPRETYTGMKT
tara:strand:+ start:369 stop:689 length:321 start_codon:yes stop_codon:yes gene_type:complete